MPDEVVSLLLPWFDANERDLPWRRLPTPWRILVSETMLQQTRIAAVVPRFEAFLARFPDPVSLANGKVEEVLALWSGLGYYRRARSLHAAATRIRDVHGGRVPADPAELRALAGVGAYTAGAVASIAFGLPEPIVDGNVERVLSRLHMVTGNVKRGPARKRIRELALGMVRAGPPARVNQAMMELGALVCLPRAPRCEECPLSGRCRALARGEPESLPVLPARREPVDVLLAMAVVREPQGALLVRAPEGGFLAGTWAPPFAVVEDGGSAPGILEESARRQHHLDLRVGAPLGEVSHTITWHRITARIHRAELRKKGGGDKAEFVPPERLRDYGLSSLARKSLRLQAR